MEFLDYIKMCQEETPGMSGETRMDDQMERQTERQMERQTERQMERQMERAGCRGMLYKVENGDTLYSISRRFDLTVRELMQANPFVNVYNLQIGEELCIPVAQGTPPEGARPYVVKRGDTVLSILKQNRITFEDLARLNRSVAVLKIPAGTVLLIP